MNEDDDVKITGFLGVFESKLERLIKKIRAEYDKPKQERNKQNLKALAREAKSLRKLVKKCKTKECICCPNCGHNIEL